jgi:NAD(P)-dependent dehydrogenase (short-subunit alcohol dehydrogenase family)
MISSVGGKNALPFAGPYAASKFALEGLSNRCAAS